MGAVRKVAVLAAVLLCAVQFPSAHAAPTLTKARIHYVGSFSSNTDVAGQTYWGVNMQSGRVPPLGVGYVTYGRTTPQLFQVAFGGSGTETNGVETGTVLTFSAVSGCQCLIDISCLSPTGSCGTYERNGSTLSATLTWVYVSSGIPGHRQWTGPYTGMTMTAKLSLLRTNGTPQSTKAVAVGTISYG